MKRITTQASIYVFPTGDMKVTFDRYHGNGLGHVLGVFQILSIFISQCSAQILWLYLMNVHLHTFYDTDQVFGLSIVFAVGKFAVSKNGSS